MPRFRKSQASATAHLPEHPFVIAGHTTFRKAIKGAIPTDREAQLIAIAAAHVTRLPPFEPRMSGWADSAGQVRSSGGMGQVPQKRGAL